MALSRVYGLPALSRALETGEYSDMTLRLSDGTEVRCHRLIMCTTVEFFANALKPNHFKESITGVIEMPNDAPDGIRKMMEYLYSGNYTTAHDLSIAEQFTTHVNVFVVATTYALEALQKLAEQRAIALMERPGRVPWSGVLGAFGAIYADVPAASSAGLQRRIYRSASPHYDAFLALPGAFRRLALEVPDLLRALTLEAVEEASADQVMCHVFGWGPERIPGNLERPRIWTLTELEDLC